MWLAFDVCDQRCTRLSKRGNRGAYLKGRKSQAKVKVRLSNLDSLRHPLDQIQVGDKRANARKRKGIQWTMEGEGNGAWVSRWLRSPCQANRLSFDKMVSNSVGGLDLYIYHAHSKDLFKRDF